MFDRFGFARTVPSSKQRPAVANEKYRVEPLTQIFGATLEALHRIKNSILGVHPLVPGSRSSEVLIPTQRVIIGWFICDADVFLRREIDSATGAIASALEAVPAPWETKKAISIAEIASVIMATMRSRAREKSRRDRYPSLPSELLSTT